MIGVKLAEHSEVWKTLTRDIRWGQHWQAPRAGSRIFFRMGCTHLLLYFNTNKPLVIIFFCRIPVVLENRRSSRGGMNTPCTLPLDPLLKPERTIHEIQRFLYSRNSRYGHLSTMDSSLLRTVSNVPTKFSYIFFDMLTIDWSLLKHNLKIVTHKQRQ